VKKPPDKKTLMKWAAIGGALLALVCHFLPHDYQAVCKAVASLCVP
jgi:hypothetical protein